MNQIKEKDFKEKVMNFKGVTVADFYADWCGPCRMLSPMLEAMSSKNKDKKVQFVKINVDEEQELAGMFGVMSIPTVIIFRDGKVYDQRVGVSTEDDYASVIKLAKENPPKKIKEGKDEVVIFTTPTCPYCHMAKNYLKSKKVDYKEIDVSVDQDWARKMIEKTGQYGVPQLWIAGQAVVGFDRPQIDTLLNL